MSAIKKSFNLAGLISQPTGGAIPPKFRINSKNYPLLMWAISVSFVLFQFFIQLSSGEIVAGLMHSFQLSAFGASVLASAYYYVYVSLQTPAGMLMDRFGPRRLLTAGAFVTAVGSFCFAMSANLWLALVGRLLMGGGSAFAFVGALNVISRWFPVERFGMMVSVSETVGMLGNIVGAVVFASLIIHFGWRDCMLATAFIALLVSVLLWTIVRDMPKNVVGITQQVPQKFWEDLRALIRQPLLWVNGCYAGLVFSVASVFLALWGVPFLQYTHNYSLVAATTVDDTAFFGVAFGCLLFGYLDNRFPTKRRQFLVSGALLAASMLSVVIFIPGLPSPLLVLVMLLLGIAVGTYVLTLALANEIAATSVRATSVGFTNMLTMVMAPIFQPLVGLLLKTLEQHARVSHPLVSHYQVALLILPILLLCAAVLGCYLPNKAAVL